MSFLLEFSFLPPKFNPYIKRRSAYELDWGEKNFYCICSKQRWSTNYLTIKKESTWSSGNKWRKTFYLDYLHRIANFCATVLNIFSKSFLTKRRGLWTPSVGSSCNSAIRQLWQESCSEAISDSAECSVQLWHVVVTQVLTPAVHSHFVLTFFALRNMNGQKLSIVYVCFICFFIQGPKITYDCRLSRQRSFLV